jgi:hypothetical protein
MDRSSWILGSARGPPPGGCVAAHAKSSTAANALANAGGIGVFSLARSDRSQKRTFVSSAMNSVVLVATTPLGTSAFGVYDRIALTGTPTYSMNLPSSKVT